MTSSVLWLIALPVLQRRHHTAWQRFVVCSPTGRLLARVFTQAPDEWVVKGAAGLLARIPGRARHTIDVDLYFAGEFDAALGALREAAYVDLGDYFTFDIDRGPPVTGVAAGGQLSVTTYLGDKEFDWHEGYRKIAETVPVFEILHAQEGVRIVRRLVDPVIGGLRDAMWDPDVQEWRRR